MADQALRACELGMTERELELMFDNPEMLARFHQWMRGQTLAYCGEHGMVYYRHDVERFMRGLPVID